MKMEIAEKYPYKEKKDRYILPNPGGGGGGGAVTSEIYVCIYCLCLL